MARIKFNSILLYKAVFISVVWNIYVQLLYNGINIGAETLVDPIWMALPSNYAKNFAKYRS